MMLRFLTLIILFLQCHVLLAQDADSTLNVVYIRQRTPSNYQLVSLSVNHSLRWDLSEDDCFSISPNTNYLAIFISEAQEIRIYQLSDGEVIFTLPTLETDCFYQWQNETNLLIATEASHQTLINVLDRSALPILTERATPVPQPQIPNLIEDDFRLFSPDRRLIVYNYCLSDEYIINILEDLVCTSEEQVVVYDVTAQQIIHTLANTSQGLFTQVEEKLLAFSFGRIGWSPSGQYLAYRITSMGENTPRLSIYDTTTDRTTDVYLSRRWGINRFKPFFWTPSETQLIFWVIDYQASGSRILNVDVATGAVQYSHLLASDQRSQWTAFTEDSFLFLDMERNLVEYNINTQETQILDSDIWNILSR